MASSAAAGPVRLTVRAASASSPVEIAANLSERVPAALDASSLPRRRFIVASTTVWRLHGERFQSITAEDPILLPDGERYKQLATVVRIYDALIRAQADRGSAIVAIGGGVLGDIAGFAAATYLRGIPYVQVPTTLLAQVDSAIGGKVGVNHPMGKNLIGAFHQPSAVLVDPMLLVTLPRREFRAGLYEVVKYGLIASRPLFDRVSTELDSLFARDASALVPTIADCCTIKARIVESDERESGPRRVLNLGHTVGHALEAVTKYRRLRHGEAVGYGLLAAAQLGVARGTMPEADRAALAALIAKMGPLPAIGDLEASQVVAAAGRDKKVVAGTLHFVLPGPIGTTQIATDVTSAELHEALVAIGFAPGGVANSEL
jgi:3-dehydroquinate synthase